jgi:glycosyltransferase involved in cell wall biosynthesis
MARLCILTNFDSWNDAYSLTHVVREQARCLVRHGHQVTVFVREDCTPHNAGCSQFACLPAFTPALYRSIADLTDAHKNIAEKTSTLLVSNLEHYDAVFTHDWILTGPNLPYAEALRMSCDALRGKPFLHWVHSEYRGGKDWCLLKRYGNGHRIIYPNRIDKHFVGEAFGSDSDAVRSIPHVKDLRNYFDFAPLTRQIIDALPGLMQADFVQVYPVAADRLDSKGLRDLILVFKMLKQRDATVCLLIVDSWTGKSSKQDISKYQRLAESNGLTSQEIAFSSTLMNRLLPDGLLSRIIRELQQCSNVFVNPTRGETFGLCLPEAGLAGGVLPVLNASLPMMFEVSGMCGLAFEFGSQHRHFKPANEREYFQRIASHIVACASKDDCWRYRTFVRQNLNMDAVYQKFYEPILTEAMDLWV